MGEERIMMRRRREEITRVSWRPWQRSTERKSRPTSSADNHNIIKYRYGSQEHGQLQDFKRLYHLVVF
jgi:hypothetical protein